MELIRLVFAIKDGFRILQFIILVPLDIGLGMHRISGRPDNTAFFDIRYPAGDQIGQPDIRPDIR
jgi:hypothetical protein